MGFLEEMSGIENPTEEEQEQIAEIRPTLNGILDNMNIERPDSQNLFDYQELRFHF
jgi:hypothetical protein